MCARFTSRRVDTFDRKLLQFFWVTLASRGGNTRSPHGCAAALDSRSRGVILSRAPGLSRMNGLKPTVIRKYLMVNESLTGRS